MIKKIRISKGWSQEQLSQFSGLSVRTIQRIERGHNAGLESLKCIAAAFDMDISRLQKENEDEDELFMGSNPILPVVSVEDTTHFYATNLGFDIEILWQQPPYGVVARGRTIIEFGEGRKEFSGSGICLIFVTDVDEVYREYLDSVCPEMKESKFYPQILSITLLRSDASAIVFRSYESSKCLN
jgi:transcriptional regulator with XRE-family HTH domain